MGGGGGGIGAVVGGALGGIPGAILGGVAGSGGLGPQQASTNGTFGAQEQLSDEAFRQRQMLYKQQANQESFANQLADRALGKGPSLADAQMRAAQDRSIAQQIAMARSMRGANPGLASRNLQMSAANQAQQVNQAAAQARLQEQNLAAQQYGGYLGQQQGYAQGLMTGQAGAAAQNFGANAANAQAQNQFTGNLLGTAGSMGMMAMMSDKKAKKNIKSESYKEVSDEKEKQEIKSELKDQAKMKLMESFSGMAQQPSAEINSAISGNLFAAALANAGKKESNPFSGLGKMAEMYMNKSGSSAKAPDMGLSAIKSGGMMMDPSMSDEKEKSAKKSESKKSDDMSSRKFLDALSPYSYEYKNPSKPGAGEGRYLSVMAQDLEKAGPVGKSMVSENEDGTKMVDYGKGFGAILAAQADLNKRLADIEKRKKA